jgi:CHAT domain-containing protein/tetratricopeptide (TPR) repeat protein
MEGGAILVRTTERAQPAVAAFDAVSLVATDPSGARRLATELLKSTADSADAAQAEWALGLLARGEQDMAAAVEHFGRSVRHAERAGALATAAEVRTSLALALAYQGRIALALRELDRAATTVSTARRGRIDLQRGAVRQIQGKLDDALDAYDRAEPLLRAADDLSMLAALHNNRGLILMRRGVLAGAETESLRSVELYRELGQHRAAAEAARNAGLLAARRGDIIAALAAFDDADGYEAAAPGPDGHGHGPGESEEDGVDAVGLLDRAEALLAARLLVEARDIAERAVPVLRRRKLDAYAAVVQLVLAQIALLDGRLDEARELAETTSAVFAKQGRHSYRAAAAVTALRAAWAAGNATPELLAEASRLTTRLEAAGWSVAALDSRLVAGQIALALGRTRTARSRLGPLARRTQQDPADVRSRVFHARALLHLAAGDRRRAEVALRAGMAAVERHREAMGGTELRANASAHAAELAGLGTRLALEDGAADRVLRWAERWRAGVLALRPVRPPGETELAANLAQLRQVVHAQADASGRELARLTRTQVTLERAVQRLARHSSSTRRYQPGPPAAAEIRKALRDEALVEFVESGGKLYAVVLTAGRQSLHELAATAEVARSAMVLRFWLRRLVHRFGNQAGLDRAERQAESEASHLDGLLLAPLAERLAGRPLVIVPTTVLHALPWALLPALAGRSVTVAPSAAWWQRAATAGTTWRVGPGRVLLAAGPELPEGEAEVLDLAAEYADAECLTGPHATVGAVGKALDGVDLAHVAAHGTFRADQPLLSSLRLADGPITVYDLEQLKRTPRVMVLAACDAGVAAVRPGDELMGLAAALLAQGTVALIAPLFPVQDAATRPTMLALHRALRAGAAPAAALAAATAPANGPDRFTAAAFVCLGAG